MMLLNGFVSFCYRYIRYFDVCIIDEASQCTEPWSLVALQYQIKSLILVGDPNQLCPVVLSPVGLFLVFQFFSFHMKKINNLTCQFKFVSRFAEKRISSNHCSLVYLIRYRAMTSTMIKTSMK